MTTYPPLLTPGVRLVRDGELKPSEWANMCCNMIEALDSDLKAWSYFNRDQVMERATALDAIDWKTEKPDPVLAGAPLGVKDIFNTADHPNSMGSLARAGYWPGNDARVVGWSKLYGAQIIGKTTTAEFAVDWAPETVNPRSPGLHAGTSSTGAAVAVATGMVPCSFATQSAGSIARPASYNGVVGYKPSFGLIPRTGVLKTCDTLDSVGWITRSVEDAQLILNIARVRGESYPMSMRGIQKNTERFADRKTFKVAALKAPGWDQIADDINDKMSDMLMQLNNKPGISLVDLDLRETLATAHPTHATIYDKSLAYYFFRELGERDKISPVFNAIVERAKHITPEDFHNAMAEQDRLVGVMEQEFKDVDFLVLPTTANEAPKSDQPEPKDSSLIWTMTGCPSVTLPLLEGANGLPVGVTVVGPKYSDMQLLEFVRREIMPDPIDVFVPASIAGKIDSVA